MSTGLCVKGGCCVCYRLVTSVFCLNGNAKQADISRAFGVTLIGVERAVKLYRQQGVQGIHAQPKRRGPATR